MKRQISKLQRDKEHLLKEVHSEKETKEAYKQQLYDKSNQVVQLMTSNTKLTREYERISKCARGCVRRLLTTLMLRYGYKS